jgi:pyruvate,water dikinase
MSTVAAPQVIPAPDGFPVRWKSPEDDRLLWERDRAHFPDVLTPMEFAAIETMVGHGSSAALAAYEAPIAGIEVRSFNGWYYQAVVPVLGSPEELAERGARAEANLRAAIESMHSLWESNWLPEIREHLAAWDGFDLAGASNAEFIAHWDETWERQRRLWELHFRIVLPAYLAMSAFDDLYRDLFGEGEALDSYALLEGVHNMTVETGQALWRLSRRALASDEIRSVLEQEATDGVIPALEASGSAVAQAFLAELREYLERYGHRGDKWSITAPTWVEDPSPAIKNLRDYITRPDSEAPAVTTRAAAHRADGALAEARERLAAYPEPVRMQFEGMLAAAKVGSALSEDHNFWIDMNGLSRARYVILEAGRRLAEMGVIESAEDVFLLKPYEVRQSLVAGPSRVRGALVAQRARDLAAAAGMTPPPAMGTVPAGPMPDDPVTRMLVKFAGGPAAPAAPGEIVGSSGSRGTVRGVARIVRSIVEAERLAPGEILVAETTAPPWTPLFATAAAVVTDTGGVLSHCAVVAREYGIPAVVGTGTATAMIADGQEIEVDGDAGIVRLL